MKNLEELQFITRYKFDKDRSKPGRSLQSVKVGDVYISRIEVEPYHVLGNLYYKTANIIFFLERGRVQMKCIQMNTEKENESVIHPGDGIIHIPPYTAMAWRNLESDPAVVMMISNKTIVGTNGDDVEHIIYTKER